MSDGPIEAVRAALVPVNRAGWPFVALVFGGAIVLGWIWEPLFWVGLIATAWCAYFFRDPERVTPQGVDLIVSPADGEVLAPTVRAPPPELGLGGNPRVCVSIFMNIFDVHINRSPVAGEVRARAYHKGSFLNASLDKASDENERMSWLIRDPAGREVVLVQIAGLIARRIVPFVEQGAGIAAGERLGLIRFGSRCDIYLPDGFEPWIAEGQRSIAGETIIAASPKGRPTGGGRTS